jgi:hypothetical protein
VLQQPETGLHLGYHLDPVQGPAGCSLREVSPLPGAAAHLTFEQVFELSFQRNPARLRAGVARVAFDRFGEIGVKIGPAFLGCSFLLLGLTVSAGQKQGPVSNNIPNPKIIPTAGNVNPADNDMKSGSMGRPDSDTPDADLDTLRRERFAKAITIEFHKKNIADSQRLLELAKALSTEFGATDSPLPATGDLNKAKEIEKLARQVKQRLIQTQ